MTTRSIHFFSEETSFVLKHKAKIRNWILEILKTERKTIHNLNIIFCSDKVLYEINENYLNKSYYTDVIAFSYTEEKNNINGDVFISIDRVKENAKLFKNNLYNELKRVIAHGILHLCGYNDGTKTQKQIMTDKEDECLQLFASCCLSESEAPPPRLRNSS